MKGISDVVRFHAVLLPLNERGVFDYVITIGILAISINLLSSISFQPMKYEDALDVFISNKLTKSDLVEIAHILQDRCLLNELDKPQLISPKLYIKDVVSRMDIHHYEMRELSKDVRYVINYVKDKYNLVSTLIATK